jgi:hypothetical protein
MTTSSLARLGFAPCALFVTSLGFVPACASSSAPPAAVDTPAPTVTYEALRDDMRQLWSEHVIWTRVVILSAAGGLPDLPFATERLLRNQADIGEALAAYYGEANGQQITALLREHILIAADLIYAAAGGDAQALSDANTRWIANADAIAAFFASLNGAWAENDLRQLMREHLSQTAAEATARLSGDFDADVLAYDVVNEHILDMADVFTDGIAAQFPDKVAAPALGARAAGLHLVMRKLWMDHASWERFFLMTTTSNLPDLGQVTDRLLRNAADLGDVLRPYYGDAAGDQLTSLLRTHILLTGSLVGAASAGDTREVEQVQRLWNDNGNEIADFLYSANPSFWSDADLRQQLQTHLGQTFDEARARLAADFTRDVAIFDAIELHILGLADTLSDGINAQFTTLSLH